MPASSNIKFMIDRSSGVILSTPPRLATHLLCHRRVSIFLFGKLLQSNLEHHHFTMYFETAYQKKVQISSASIRLFPCMIFVSMSRRAMWSADQPDRWATANNSAVWSALQPSKSKPLLRRWIAMRAERRVAVIVSIVGVSIGGVSLALGSPEFWVSKRAERHRLRLNILHLSQTWSQDLMFLVAVNLNLRIRIWLLKGYADDCMLLWRKAWALVTSNFAVLKEKDLNAKAG